MISVTVVNLVSDLLRFRPYTIIKKENLTRLSLEQHIFLSLPRTLWNFFYYYPEDNDLFIYLVIENFVFKCDFYSSKSKA